jgi:TP901-1 family phage major tail protein
MIINGHNLRWKIGGVAIAKATDCTISISGETRDTSHKDIGTGEGAGWAGASYGKKSWEGTCSALYAEDDSFETLWDAFNGNTAIAVEFSDGVVGNKKFTGSAIITSLEQNAPDNEDVTFSVSFAGNGALTRADQT